MVGQKKNSNLDKKKAMKPSTGWGPRKTRTNRPHGNLGPRDVRSVQEKKEKETTICEDEDVPAKKASKEPTRKEKKAKVKDSKENGMKRSARAPKASAEVVKEPVDPEKELLIKTKAAILALCNYVLTEIPKNSVSSHFDEVLSKYRNDKPTTEFDKNAAKNRDSGANNTKLFDHSRVKLEPAGNITSDYINASLVKFDKDTSDTEFIMTQYPSHEYTFDFWRMCWQFDVSRVIAIFEPYDDEAIEEFRKIPDTLPVTPTSPGSMSSNGSPSNTGSVIKSQTQQLIEGNSTRCDTNLTKCFFPLFEGHYMNLNGWLINIRKVEVDERNKSWISTYHVELVPDGCSDAKMVRVFNCPTWPWKTIPRDDKKLLALVRTPWKDLPDTLEMSADGPKVVKHRPVVVMCDLGLDRSAAIVFTYVMIEMVLAGKVPKPEQIFKQMRDQRNGVFTQSMFYTYSLRAVLLYVKIKFKNVDFDSLPPKDKKDAKPLFDQVDLALEKLPISGNAIPVVQ